MSTNPFTLANAKKAYVAGVAGAVTAAGGLSLGAVFTGGNVDTNTLLADAGIVLGGFVIAFFGAWLPSNAVVPTDAPLPPVPSESDNLGLTSTDTPAT